jgi:ATP-dependent RNA helicase SUPV3L1/SUV3
MPVPALTARRLCQLAPCLSRRRLLPYIQTANRSDASSTKGKREGGPPPAFKRISRAPFNPFKAGREFPRAFEDILSQRLATVRHDLSQPKFVQSLHLTREAFDAEWATFERAVHNWVKRATPEAYFLAEERARAVQKTDQKLRQLFYVHLFGDKFTSAEIDNQKALANLRYPAEWYPATRQMPRTVHMHVGPTNSGKTYHALKRLEEADSGIYLGPLRLLAHEVYTRLNAKGKLCALVTGEEQRVPDGETKMWSCTVEMAPLNQALEVAVIDEIQMISHKERGWAWTAAFLGLQAREIHVCGEARTVPLMRELCALVGDKVEVHEYERLTPLKVADNSLKGNLRDNLQKGDCIVSFSVLGIHALRKAIENATGRKCAIVYGGLPPETRAQQAKLFNDPDNEYDFLVASDAIGMGLNL